MFLEKFIRTNRKTFQSLCEAHQVDTLYAFGSSITARFNQDISDIDLLVSIDAADRLEKERILLSLGVGLEKFFDRKVDLLTPEAIRNPFLKASIDRTRKLIYDREGENIS
jgi:uncharacterized protein